MVLYLNINQLDALNFIMSLFHASTCFEHYCALRQEVKIVQYSLWYHHTETSEWFFSKITKITKIQFYKYEHILTYLLHGAESFLRS